MVTTNLMGGLGNQMFQIATVYAYAKRHGFEYGFNFDTCYTPNQGNTSSKYKDSFFKDIIRLDNTHFNMEYREPSFSFNEIPKNDNILLDGYFQSEKYFKDNKNEIRKLFHFSEEIVIKIYMFLANEFPKNKRPITSIHIRRGDYTKSADFHTNLFETDYYNMAMELIGGNFIVVSDDIEWCKENFKGDNIFYSPFTEELEDLFLMMNCDNQIIANSSFSWWGAYLKRQMIEDSVVIAPKQWFGPKGPQDTQDIIPYN